MPEKRFELAWEDFDGWAIYDTTGEYSNDEDYIDWLSGQKAVDVLNHFAEENEELKLRLNHLEYRFFEYKDKIKSLPKDEVGEVLQKYYNQELGLFTHDTLEKIAKELGIDLK